MVGRAGLIAAIALGEPFGFDLLGYHEPESADWRITSVTWCWGR
jgi:hypothetical protein